MPRLLQGKQPRLAEGAGGSGAGERRRRRSPCGEGDAAGELLLPSVPVGPGPRPLGHRGVERFPAAPVGPWRGPSRAGLGRAGSPLPSSRRDGGRLSRRRVPLASCPGPGCERRGSPGLGGLPGEAAVALWQPGAGPGGGGGRLPRSRGRRAGRAPPPPLAKPPPGLAEGWAAGGRWRGPGCGALSGW